MMPAPRFEKTYIHVIVDFDENGTMLPRALTWKDGRKYPIDRIKDIRSAPALKAGGQGDRYTVMIAGQERYLFFEHNTDYGNRQIGKWFVESPI